MSLFLPLLFSILKISILNSLIFNFVDSHDISHQVVYAVNCGGNEHTDSNGIVYQSDLLDSEGIVSDFGLAFYISGIPDRDQILFQTERYSTNTFGYNIPLVEEGLYVLVTKFSEVYFNEPNKKVFDVRLNSQITIIKDLDIYSKSGKAVAYEEYSEFVLKNGQIYVGSESFIHNGVLSVEFVKGWLDNPKVNALVLIKGTLQDIPKVSLPESSKVETIQNVDRENYFTHTSGPKTINPYDSEEYSVLPIFVSIVLFVSLIFCLCRLY